MKRREFLSTSGKTVALTTLATGLSGINVQALTSSPVLNSLHKLVADSDRVLVLVQLSGGNDGLNTVIPVDDALYYQNRKNINIPKAQTLKIRDGLGFHPAMTGLSQLFNDGRLSIVQNVTYPNPDRSHFRGTDIWMTATDTDVFKSTGWLGRYLQTLAPDFPTTMPTEPLAIQIGETLALGFKGDKGSLGITFRDPDSFYSLVDQSVNSNYDAAPSTLGGAELDFVRSVEVASQVYSKAVKAAADRVKKTKVTYPATNPLAKSLEIVSRLIAGGLSTKIYLVNVSGSFDTHISQGGASGAHATLLGYLSEAIKVFLDDCHEFGTEDRVAGLTFSEFGRRVAENGSQGTDHGTAAPLFVFGKNIVGPKQVLGKNPDLINLDNRGDLLMEFDYRQIYAATLLQWFGAGKSTTSEALLRDFTDLPLFSQLSDVRDAENTFLLNSMSNFPNPADEATAISYMLPSAADVLITLHDLRGAAIATVFSGYKQSGPQSVIARTSSLAPSTYFYKIRAGRMEQMKAMQVVR